MRFVSIDSIYPTEAASDEQAIVEARDYFIESLERDRAEPASAVQHIVWLVEVEDTGDTDGADSTDGGASED